MKIALCLSGQPRYVEAGYEHIKRNFLSKYDIDVFCHLWFDKDLHGTPFSYTYYYPERQELWRKNLDEIIINLYSPKLYSFEKPKTFWFDPNANYGNGKTNNCSMFYSIQKANELKIEYERVNSFKYDIVIRARTDLIIHNCNLDLNNLDLNSIHMATAGDKLSDGTPIINDQLAIGKSSYIDAYSSVYNFLNFYWDRDKPNSMVGEGILTRHLKNCHVPFIGYPPEVLSNTIKVSN